MGVDPQLPRVLWPIGKGSCVHPSDNERIRSADTDIKWTVYTRPVTKLVLLPKLPDEDDNKNTP